MPADLVAVIALALIGLNGLTFAAFGFDKAAARAGRRRVPEAQLLLFAFLGGTPGAFAGRALFRHKTRKQPFSSELWGIAILQAVVSGGGLGWWLGG
jgi:uncharacterized membrane protein YsdA (DUF1294 family)